MDVANREYAGLNKNYQFTQAEGSSKYFCEAISATDSLVITKITDANVLGDEHLGYKYLTKDELMITNYATTSTLIQWKNTLLRWLVATN